MSVNVSVAAERKQCLRHLIVWSGEARTRGSFDERQQLEQGIAAARLMMA